MRPCGSNKYSFIVIIIPVVITIFSFSLTNQNAKIKSLSSTSSSLSNGLSTTTLRPNNHRQLGSKEKDQIVPTDEKAAVAILVPNTDHDLHDLCYAFFSLRRSKTIIQFKTPILIFHQEDFTFARTQKIRSCTENPVFFFTVIFKLPHMAEATNERDRQFEKRVARMGQDLGREKRGYSQMIRFWTTAIWRHEAVQQFDTIMRIDTDSCFTSGGKALDDWLPSVPDGLDYRANHIGLGSNEWVRGLYDFAVEYMKKNRIVPANMKLWEHVKSAWRGELGDRTKTLPVFQTNFEVDRVAFFKRYDVMKWHAALTEKEPFGVFRYRWGDAQTRVLTMAMFAEEGRISHAKHPGYVHGRKKCDAWANSLK